MSTDTKDNVNNDVKDGTNSEYACDAQDAHVMNPPKTNSKQSTSDPATAEDGLEPEVDIIFLLGGPGSGKGSLSEHIRSLPSSELAHLLDLPKNYVHFNPFTHLSIGDFLRLQAGISTSNSSYDAPCADATMITEYIRIGKLLPWPVLRKHLQTGILRAALTSGHATTRTWLLLDGFPRCLPQLHDFLAEASLWSSGMRLHLLGALHVTCREETMIKRVRDRARVGDAMEMIGKRVEGYLTDTMPVVEWFRGMEGRLVEVDSEGRAVEETWKAVKEGLKALMKMPPMMVGTGGP
ncbi:hypothetical protein BDZ91DRAFT_710595 [Kalaharituber pfeilii]|nr:hypothetical protein BDZ91DRAFT_710595 [Kalaharituber pfeilii]